MFRSRATLIPAALLLLGVIGLAVSIPLMAKRLQSRHIPMVWFQAPLEGQEFLFQGERVHIDVVESADPAAAGRVLKIDFRGRELLFPIEPGMQDDPRLPGLKRFEDWLRVVPMFTGVQTEEQIEHDIADGSRHPKLLVAMRLLAQGYDPDSWGLVRRKDWRYRFALLDAKAPLEDAVEIVEGSYVDLDLLGDPVYRAREGREDEVWKFHAMLQVTPATAYRSKNRPLSEVMGTMGWTWPIAGFSILAIFGGVAGLALRGLSRPRD